MQSCILLTCILFLDTFRIKSERFREIKSEMVKLLGFLDRHKARHLFRSSHLNLRFQFLLAACLESQSCVAVAYPKVPGSEIDRTKSRVYFSRTSKEGKFVNFQFSYHAFVFRLGIKNIFFARN